MDTRKKGKAFISGGRADDKQKYKYVKNMLSPDMIEFLTSWSQKNFNPPDLDLGIIGDGQFPLSSANHSSHSDIYQHITYFLLPIMEKETNLKLKPIYSYTRIYLGGAELKKHVDRPSCEISASITLKYFFHSSLLISLRNKFPSLLLMTPHLIFFSFIFCRIFKALGIGLIFLR